MARASIEDPLKVFRFTANITNFARSSFSEISGIDMSITVERYREGGFNETAQKSAGQAEFPDVTFTRGQIFSVQRGDGSDLDMINWMNMIYQVTTIGNAINYRQDITVSQYSANNTLAREWTLVEAWPCGFKPLTELKGMGNENSYESMKIAHEGWYPTI